MVVPIRNGGSGIALTIGDPVVVQTCDGEPRVLATDAENAATPDTARAVKGPLGSYVLPSGESDQLAFVATNYIGVHGQVSVHGTPTWYTLDYGQFGVMKSSPPDRDFPNLLIWYTDGAQRKLRWVCIQYYYTDSRGQEYEWAVNKQTYGAAKFPDFLKVS